MANVNLVHPFMRVTNYITMHFTKSDCVLCEVVLVVVVFVWLYWFSLCIDACGDCLLVVCCCCLICCGLLILWLCVCWGGLCMVG
jgi:hypothetical protein